MGGRKDLTTLEAILVRLKEGRSQLCEYIGSFPAGNATERKIMWVHLRGTQRRYVVYHYTINGKWTAHNCRSIGEAITVYNLIRIE